MNFLICKGQRTATIVCDATNDIMHDAFNTLFSSCHFSLEDIEET